MKRVALSLFLASVPAPAFAQAPAIPRAPDGHPDFTGNWATRIMTPMERPDGVADLVTDPIDIPYAELPAFPVLGVAGHAGSLRLGCIGGRAVALLRGRRHAYETGDAAAMKGAIRTLAAWGVTTLLLTNAAGSLAPEMPAGSLMLISDHLNIVQRTPLHDEPGSARFIDMVNAYDSTLRDQAAAAVIEAKRTRKDALVGQQQAKLYADCLQATYGRRPVIFCTNGYEHWLWDDAMYPPRPVSGFYKKDELELLHQRRKSRKKLDEVDVDEGIAGRFYQARAIRRVGEAFEKDHQRKALLVMATGSGKTQSLYACLNLLNTAEVNIATVEDPCEIQLQGVNQVNVQDKPGLTFAVALRAFLRQDPDILMVGEIRDLETANIAVQAAQTGHLVLSTLHTNDAPSTLVRLRNMGTATYNIAASVTLITAQRLVRRLCPHCKQKITLPRETLLQAGLPATLLPTGAIEVYTPQACAQCHKGFAGRTGIFQVMPMSAALQALVLEDASTQALAAQAAREGVASLRVAGLRKVMQGITSLEEVLAATREDDGEAT